MRNSKDLLTALQQVKGNYQDLERIRDEERKLRLEKFKVYVMNACLQVDSGFFNPRGINMTVQFKNDLSCEGSGGLFSYMTKEIFSIFAEKGAEVNFIECIKIYLDVFSLNRLVTFLREQDSAFMNLCGGLFLVFAAQDNNVKLMEFLIKEKKVSPNAIYFGLDKASVLQVLCSLCIFNKYGAEDFEINFKLLVENGAVIDYQNQKGHTALMLVSESCEFNPGFKLLLDLYANPYLRNSDNQTVESLLVRQSNHFEKYRDQMMEQLEEAYIKFEIKDSFPQFSSNLLNMIYSYLDPASEPELGIDSPSVT